MMELIAYVTDLAMRFTEFTRSNPVMGGVVGVWAAGTLSVMIRYLPNAIRTIIIKQFTVSVVIHNSDNLFDEFATWYEKEGYAKRARTMRATSGKRKADISLGYGIHYFWVGWRLFKVTRSQEPANNTIQVKETVTISTIGRKQIAIREMLNKCIPQEDRSFTNIYTYEDNWWRCSYIQPSRSMDTIFMPKESKTALIRSVNEFLGSKDFYKKHAIPYRMGLAFHGVPGTGKTSMVKALCHHLGRNLYVISLVKLDDNGLVRALNSVSDNAVVLIEDIDTYDHCASRATPASAPGKPAGDSLSKVMESLSGLTLSGILNAIDGVVSINDRILIMTTNHFDHLDPALKRKGRIDFDLKFDYLDDETFRAMMAKIYPDFTIPLEFKIAANIAPVDMQSIILEFKDDPESVLKRLARSTT